MPVLTVMLTCASKKEAERVANALVRERLAACANYFPCSSVYRWKGKLHREGEWILLAKAPERKFAAIERRLRRIHSGELPALVAWKDSAFSPALERWVSMSCAP